jgi:hypothetical protein
MLLLLQIKTLGFLGGQLNMPRLSARLTEEDMKIVAKEKLAFGRKAMLVMEDMSFWSEEEILQGI